MIISRKISGISPSPSHMSLSISIFPASPLLRIKAFTAENAEAAEVNFEFKRNGNVNS